MYNYYYDDFITSENDTCVSQYNEHDILICPYDCKPCIEITCNRCSLPFMHEDEGDYDYE